jgi:hypothetical protein
LEKRLKEIELWKEKRWADMDAKMRGNGGQKVVREKVRWRVGLNSDVTEWE